MNNALIAIDKSGSFRVYLGLCPGLVSEARRIHDAGPLATAALGRALAGGGLMGLQLKGPKDKLTLQFKGDGPAGELLVTARGDGRVKGYISDPLVELPPKENGQPDVGGALGTGVLTVIKDMGLKEPYVGRIDFVTGEIADDLTAYFFISEQQNASVALGVSVDTDGTVKAAGGFVLQMLPEAAEGAAEALEKLLAELPPLSGLMEEALAKAAAEAGGPATDPAAGPGEEERAADLFLEAVFGSLPEEFALETLERRDLEWCCDCSVERLEQVLLTLGQEQLEEILREDGQAELTCQFCRKKYHFDKEHLEMLLRVSARAKEILDNRKKRQAAETAERIH
ncbi:MAG: Hsp33 family molecular chaperone HslO [Bacillota bacterium]|nr:Hsp33 family molecular chaperone HslO [Bacillota bacterium]